MKLEIKGKQVNLGDAFSTHIEDELVALADKYFGEPVSADVTVSKDGHLHVTHLMVRLGHGLRFEATGKAQGPYPSFDSALERIAKQLRRQKRKLINQSRTVRDDQPPVSARANSGTNGRSNTHHAEFGDIEKDMSSTADPVSVVVAELDSMIESLPIRDAILRLESGDRPALLFMNADQDQALNMIYRRPDGHIGWVDPAASLPMLASELSGNEGAFVGAHPKH